MVTPRYNLVTTAELLADAERYEQWAELVGNERIAQNFRKLADEARLRAKSARSGDHTIPGGN